MKKEERKREHEDGRNRRRNLKLKHEVEEPFSFGLRLRLPSSLSSVFVFAFPLFLLLSCGDPETGPAVNPPEGSTPGTPFGIAVEPGPSDGAITVSFSTVDNASKYAIYFRNTPGVTPQNGTKITGALPGFVHSQLTVGQTYYYVVTALDGDFESPESAEVSASPKATIGIHVEDPEAGVIVGTSVPIVVAMNSALALTSVTASVGGVSVPLHFTSSIGRYTGVLALDAFDSPSARIIKITAIDGQQRSAESQMLVRLDRPPELVVTSPVSQTSVSQSVRLTATCTDDFRTGCASLVAYITGFRQTPLVSVTAAVDSTVSLASYPAGPLELVFEATDSGGQVVTTTRAITKQ